MKKLLQRVKKWIIKLLTEVKDDLINASKRQWYIVVMGALLIVFYNNKEFTLGIICILAFVAMLVWWGLVKMTIVESSNKKTE